MKFEITLSFALIFIGIVMLLERVDLANDIWDYIGKYWPLLLVSLGFENLLGKKWGYILTALALTFFGFLFALFLKGRLS